MALLDVRDLRTSFKTDDGIVGAVNDVSFDLEQGRDAGDRGRVRLWQDRALHVDPGAGARPPGKISAGEVLLHDGTRPLKMKPEPSCAAYAATTWP